MRKKSKQAVECLDKPHKYVINDPQFRKDIGNSSEVDIQREWRPIIIQYLEEHFRSLGIKDPKARANTAFYWEGQEAPYGNIKEATFGARNYPDFIIQEPYLVAIEYKQSDSGSVVKHGIGQSIMHPLSGEFDFAYFLFHDMSKEKRIESAAANGEVEKAIIKRMWDEFNVYVRFV